MVVGIVRAGVGIAADLNQQLRGEGKISASDAVVRTFVVPAREDIEIARQVRAVAAWETRV